MKIEKNIPLPKKRHKWVELAKEMDIPLEKLYQNTYVKIG